MISQSIALFNFTNGTIMIVIFALVCVALVIMIMSMINGSKKEDEE